MKQLHKQCFQPHSFIIPVAVIQMISEALE